MVVFFSLNEVPDVALIRYYETLFELCIDANVAPFSQLYVIFVRYSKIYLGTVKWHFKVWSVSRSLECSSSFSCVTRISVRTTEFAIFLSVERFNDRGGKGMLSKHAGKFYVLLYISFLMVLTWNFIKCLMLRSWNGVCQTNVCVCLYLWVWQREWMDGR